MSKYINDLDNFERVDIEDAPNSDLLFDFNALESSTSNLAAQYDPSDASKTWGTPIHDSYYWRQQDGKTTCAIVAQISIYESITGEYISESTAAEYAENKGWFDPETGTLPTDSDKILNDFGIETQQLRNSDINTIISALNQGDKLIAGVDASEIWNPIYNPDTGYPSEQEDLGHAVWVTGLEQEYDGSLNFILNDSGVSFGQMNAVDSLDFMNAWNDFDNFLIVVDA